jgi:hypothetical protein
MGLSEAVARVNSPEGPVHLFHDIKINREGIGQAIKHSQSQAHSSLSPTLSDNEDNSSRAPSLSSQDSIQFRAAPSQALKHCMRNKPHVSKHVSKRLHILVNSDSEDMLIIIDSCSASPGSPMSISPILAGPSTKYLYNQPISAWASSTGSLPTVSDLLEMKLSSATVPIDSPISTMTKWPNGQYAIDIQNGIKAMSAPHLRGLRQAAQFEVTFPSVTYRQSTFNDAEHRWQLADEDLCAALIDAGRTLAGLWDVLRRQVKLKCTSTRPGGKGQRVKKRMVES